MDSISTADVAAFLADHVNLAREDVQGYREQVRYLRQSFEYHVAEHPAFDLVKMLHFGSLAKGTALSTLQDMDVAVYLRPDAVQSHELTTVLETVRSLLIQIYPQMNASQFVIDAPAVTISYRTSGLRVDVVPVIPNGEPDDRGEIATRSYPTWVETSIPLHLAFIRARSERHDHYRELVRLTKWWRDEVDASLNSFQIELLWAHLVDRGMVPNDLQEAMLAFFAYVERSRLEERIVFSDYYAPADVPQMYELVQLIDPVNPTNNVAKGMTQHDRDSVLDVAAAALDNVAAGSSAYTKGRGVTCYQRVFGSAFTA